MSNRGATLMTPARILPCVDISTGCTITSMRSQPVWKKRDRRKPALLIVLIAVLIGVLWSQRRMLFALWEWHPFVGLFIAIMAFLGVLLSLREHVGGCEKAVWIVVMLILVSLEIRSMYLYNQDELDTRNKQFGAFTTLGSKNDQLQRTLNKVDQFVEHPHPELTKEQVADVVHKTIEDDRLSQSAPPPTPPISVPTAAPTPLLSQDSRALQQEGLQMAKDINDWIASVSPGVPKTATAGAPTIEERKVLSDYAVHLNLDWRDKFGMRPQVLMGKLHVPGLNLQSCAPTVSSSSPYDILQFRLGCATKIEQAARNLQ